MKKTLLLVILLIIPVCVFCQALAHGKCIPIPKSNFSIGFCVGHYHQYGLCLLKSTTEGHPKYNEKSSIVLRIGDQVYNLPILYNGKSENTSQRTSYGDILYFSRSYYDLPEEVANIILKNDEDLVKIRVIYDVSYEDKDIKPKDGKKIIKGLRESYKEACTTFEQHKRQKNQGIENATDGF